MANILKIYNDYSYYESADLTIKHQIWEKMRFRDRGYFHNRRYKQRLWDGYTDFFKLETGKFLTGLLPEVKAALNHWKVDYSIEDYRTKIDFAHTNIGPDFLNQWLPKGAKPITLHDYQVDFINAISKHHRGIIYSPTSSGKAQPMDSLVATPSGFKRMGDLKLGEYVLTPDGKSAPITGVFPQGVKNILEIKFSNGDVVECCEDHLWKVNALYDQWKGRILTAKEIMNRHKCPNGANRFNIDVPTKIEFDQQELPLKPYFIGVLLGDGCFKLPEAIGFTSADAEIVQYIKNNLIEGYSLKQSKNRIYDYRISSGKKGKGTPKNPYVKILESLNLKGLGSSEKFIPIEYMINSSDVRLEILQGLMDTDGTISKKGALTFTSTSKILADNVKWIIQSLGGIAYVSTKQTNYTYKGIKSQGKLSYNVFFTLPEKVIPFKLKWKIARCNNTRIRNKHRTIESVKHIGEKECQCIMIDHPDHLYLTDNFVVTHNTFMMVGALKCLPENCPTLVLQNRVALAQQNYDEIASWGFDNVGSLWGGNCKPNVITVASVQSIDKIKKLLPKFKALIVDEIHDMMSSQPKAAYRLLKNCSVRMALSATPFKFGETDGVQKYYVKGFFGPVLKTKATASGILTTKELQNREILASSQGTFYPITEPMIPHDIYIDAVTRGIAESYYFHQIVTRLAKLQKGRTLILVDRIAHGDALHSMLAGSLWVQGKDNAATRKDVIKQMQKAQGDVIAIATQQIFNTGINVKVHNLINAAGGQAEHQIIQRMGRGLRTADDKDMLQYYDFLFLINDYLEQHSRKRIKILKDQGHDIVVKDKIDF